MNRREKYNGSLQQYSHEAGSRGRNNRQLDQFGGYDPFYRVNQVMESFGGFGGGFLGNHMMIPHDPFESMMGFSDLHKDIHKRGVEGSYVCQTFVSSSKKGPDGKTIQQSYFENNAGQNKNGNTISQKQQAYKNSQGIKRIAEQRMLNDKGHKILKDKRGHQIQETNHYYNIDEDEAQQFNADWRKVDSETKFLQQHQKYLRSVGNQQRQIGYGENHRDIRALGQQRAQRERGHHKSIKESRGSNKYQEGAKYLENEEGRHNFKESWKPQHTQGYKKTGSKFGNSYPYSQTNGTKKF